MTVNFTQAYRLIISGHEGGYSNHPADKGGETYRGIARLKNPHWLGWTVIDKYKQAGKLSDENLAADTALQNLVLSFYKSEYWDKFKGDDINSSKTAIELFDIAVNMGVSTAVRFLQQSINILNKNGKLWPEINEDGIMGPNTLQITNQCPEVSLLKCLNGLQFIRYWNLCTKDKSQEVFMHGWLYRITF